MTWAKVGKGGQAKNPEAGGCGQKTGAISPFLPTPVRRDSEKGKFFRALDRIPMVEHGRLTGIEFDGQSYWFTGVRIYQKADGSVIEMHGWSSSCAECGEPFEAMTIPGRKFQPRRRCSEHSKAGVRVHPRGENKSLKQRKVAA